MQPLRQVCAPDYVIVMHLSQLLLILLLSELFMTNFFIVAFDHKPRTISVAQT